MQKRHGHDKVVEFDWAKIYLERNFTDSNSEVVLVAKTEKVAPRKLWTFPPHCKLVYKFRSSDNGSNLGGREVLVESIRLLRQYLVDQQRGAFGHVSCAATGAEPAPLSTERNQVFIRTFRALHAQESVLQSDAFEVIDKFPLHMQGQWPALRGH